MKFSKRKRSKSSPYIREKLSHLEAQASERGIIVHYDLMEAAGLKLRDGMCRIRGQYHVYIDKRKTASEKMDILMDYLNNPLPEDIPSND